MQRVFSALTEDEVERLITKRLSDCSPGYTCKAISKFNWRRIFTFNVDDALENELSSSKRQSLKPIHFSDPFVDLQTNAELPLVYLHGTVKSPEKGYVFSRDQYLRMIKGENPWMVVLSGIVRNDPLIISGSSMDEVDLEYYLSFRSKATSREDVGPSIFVDTSTDRLSESLCRDHNLIQFVGYSSDFMRYLSEKITNPPLVEERIDAKGR